MALPAFNFLELCAGGGMLGVGASAGSHYVGLDPRTVGYVERDSYAAAALVARMEEQALDDAPVWDCVTSFDGRPWRGVVDCVVAGIPCQGNSLAGRRLLEDDHRNLWPATRRVIRDVGAEWFFLENVGGFLVPDREAGRSAPIARVLGELAEDGWDAEWDVVSAEECKASHRRERVFLLAHRRSRSGERDARSLPAPQAGIGGEGEQYGDLPDRPANGGGGLADAGGEPGSAEPQQQHREWPDLPGRGGLLQSQRGQDRGGVAGGAGEGVSARAVGYASKSRLEGRRPPGRGRAGERASLATGMELPVFAPARNDWRGWVRVLRADPTLVPALSRRDRSRTPSDPQAAQPAVRGILDGLAAQLECRGDRLRLCGNGVVWQAAAEAFVRLWLRLNGEE